MRKAARGRLLPPGLTTGQVRICGDEVIVKARRYGRRTARLQGLVHCFDEPPVAPLPLARSGKAGRSGWPCAARPGHWAAPGADQRPQTVSVDQCFAEFFETAASPRRLNPRIRTSATRSNQVRHQLNRRFRQRVLPGLQKVPDLRPSSLVRIAQGPAGSARLFQHGLGRVQRPRGSPG